VDAAGNLPLSGDEPLSKKRIFRNQFDATANETAVSPQTNPEGDRSRVESHTVHPRMECVAGRGAGEDWFAALDARIDPGTAGTVASARLETDADDDRSPANWQRAGQSVTLVLGEAYGSRLTLDAGLAHDPSIRTSLRGRCGGAHFAKPIHTLGHMNDRKF
jgi:hypothetical protein